MFKNKFNFCENKDGDSYSPFPDDVFPKDVFPEDVFPPDIFPRDDNPREEDEGDLDLKA